MKQQPSDLSRRSLLKALTVGMGTVVTAVLPLTATDLTAVPGEPS